MTSGELPQTPDDKRRILNRLRRLKGQVRGLHRMVEEGRECQEILTVLSGVRHALDAAGDVILQDYLTGCAAGDEPRSVPDIIRAVRLLR